MNRVNEAPALEKGPSPRKTTHGQDGEERENIRRHKGWRAA